MRKLLLLLPFVPLAADAATLTLPSITVQSPPSTSITCNAVGAPYTAPLAAGTVVYSCTVAPPDWQGAVSLSGTQFVVGALLSSTTFNVSVGAAALPAGSYAPGTLTAVP